jgi:hypothetical protein
MLIFDMILMPLIRKTSAQGSSQCFYQNKNGVCPFTHIFKFTEPYIGNYSFRGCKEKKSI